jgi:phosphoribosylformylglycinamidine cyclo-ligase
VTPKRLTYRDAGVDITAGDEAVERIASLAPSTFRDGVIGGLGGFAGAFDFGAVSVKNPVLLSATDGVGTKIEIARALNVHDTVGVDLVAMVVDDLVCNGAEPLFFLDYIACGAVVPDRIERIVSGIAEGCRVAGCALLGGETAEHPGVMEPDAYDLAGFGVGVAGRDAMWGPDRVGAGDELIGLASSGVHANGFSLVRALQLDLSAVPKGWSRAIGEELLEPTRIYARAVLSLPSSGVDVHAAAHITGGGIEGNVVRAMPDGARAELIAGSWPEPAVFGLLRSAGEIGEDEMRRTFNLGLGMVAAVAAGHSRRAIERLGEQGFEAFEVGRVVGIGAGKREAVIVS